MFSVKEPSFTMQSRLLRGRRLQLTASQLRLKQLSMTKPSNKELIRRWIAFANTGFTGSLDEFIAPHYVGHLGGSTMDRVELERLEREFRRAFPDTHHSIDDLIAEDDSVALRATALATHRGEFQGIAPTGWNIEFTAMVIYRIECNKIAETWGEIDFPKLMRQLRST